MSSPGASIAFTDALVNSIQAAIDAGHIGAPVFVRWTIRISDGLPVSEPVDSAAASISQWFGAPAGYVHRTVGSTADATLHARWPGGQSAIITAGPCLPGDRPGVDIMVLGSRGAIYHDGQAVRRLDAEV